MTQTNELPKKQTHSKPLIVLIHGLHQRHWVMKPLARQFKKLGYDTLSFDYSSLTEEITEHSNKLNEWLLDHLESNQPFHIVAHSLGGLVIRDFVSRFPQWHANGQIKNCVTLGTPHMGSTAADYANKIAPFSVGSSYKGALDGNANPLPDGICVGVIAGNKPYGMGQPILDWHSLKQTSDRVKQETLADNKQTRAKRFTEEMLNQDNRQPHDGTVYVLETMLPNASDHIIMPITHTGMLVNSDVVKQTVYFLNNGEFNRA